MKFNTSTKTPSYSSPTPNKAAPKPPAQTAPMPSSVPTQYPPTSQVPTQYPQQAPAQYPPMSQAPSQYPPSQAQYNSSPEDVQSSFRNEGLLVRTVQEKNAHYEFAGTGSTLPQASGEETPYLRKWSYAHQNLQPNYFNMGPDSVFFGRHMGVVARPEQVGQHVVGVYQKDAFSGNVQPGMTTMPVDQANSEIANLRGQLFDAQRERPGQPLENSEIQTVGVDPAAMSGFLFHPSRVVATWDQAQPGFDNWASQAGPEFTDRTFPVFTYESTSGGTNLTHLDDINLGE